MNWVSLWQRDPSGQEKWISLNLSLAFKIEADVNGGGSIIHFINSGAVIGSFETVIEPPSKVIELAETGTTVAT